MNGDYQEACEPGNVLGIPAPLFFSPEHYIGFTPNSKHYFNYLCGLSGEKPAMR